MRAAPGAPRRGVSVETPSEDMARERGPHHAEMFLQGFSWSRCSLWVLRVSRRRCPTRKPGCPCVCPEISHAMLRWIPRPHGAGGAPHPKVAMTAPGSATQETQPSSERLGRFGGWRKKPCSGTAHGHQAWSPAPLTDCCPAHPGPLHRAVPAQPGQPGFWARAAWTGKC